jgi:GcrA cell cycle regulator
MSWTDDRVVVLKKLWLDGLSASQIAKQLGGVTRNAVIGKVHRLGLSGRAAPSQPARPATLKPARTQRPAQIAPPVATPAAAAIAPRRPEPQPPQIVRYRDESPGSATVLTLGAHMCKWPIGDPSTSGFTFCGSDCGGEGPYCDAHAEVAYQPQQKKPGRSQVADLARSLRRYM